MEGRRRDDGREPGTAPVNSAPAPGRAAAPTTGQLRADIDSGRTHDKVAKRDPAAAPLGTDDEASGNPPTPAQVATAHRHEAGRAVPEPPSASQAASHTNTRPNQAMIWTIVGVLAAAVVLALIF